jgi:hypothetical protein
MRVTDRRTIFSGIAGTTSANCCFPAIAQLADGTKLVTWRIGSFKDSADGTLLVARSIDGGRNWSPAEKVPLGPYAATPGEGHYGPLTVLNDGRILAAIMWVERSTPDLPFFHPTTEGLLPLRTFFCESHDAGRTWRNYREMDASPYQSPMPLTGPVLQLADDNLACPFEVNKSYYDTKPWRHAAAWKISHDDGHTWPECIEIANDPAGRLMYWDARYALGPNGFCVATFWTYDRSQCRDVNIHTSLSEDYGRHWTTPCDTGLAGQVCHPVLLDDGRLVLICVDRFASRTIRAVISRDLGRTFYDQVIVYEHARCQEKQSPTSSTADYLQDMDAWCFGRVDAVAGPDGQISIVYYAGTPDATSIHWARLETRDGM